MLTGKNLKKLYATFSSIYKAGVGRSFKFKRGEKGRVKNIFTYTSEAMGIRDSTRFDEVLEMVAKYVTDKTKEWLKWNHRSRNNYLGFLEKRDEIEIFVRREQVGNELNENVAEDLQIAGRDSGEQWDF
jgi:putative lipoic acid-binding regulatory protein